MNQEDYISVKELSLHYEVEQGFFNELSEMGLVEMIEESGRTFIHIETVHHVERVIRLHQDLDINLQGIDTIMNLLERIEGLQEELLRTKSRLRLYEKGEE